MHFLSGLSFNFCWLLSPYSRITTLRLVLRSSLFLFRSPALGAHYYRFLSRSTRSFFVSSFEILFVLVARNYFSLFAVSKEIILCSSVCVHDSRGFSISIKILAVRIAMRWRQFHVRTRACDVSCRIVRMLTQQARARKHSLGQQVFLAYGKLLRRHTFDFFLAIFFFFFGLLVRLKISRISKPLILLSQLYDSYNADNYSSDSFRPVTRANDYRSNEGFIHCE